ncbi:hypothetical protein FM019_05250 [Aliiglaciecola sp. M165]|nr:hypothetical protein FM019_05250 [Aliiglaciecola sp. M165]
MYILKHFTTGIVSNCVL